MNKIMDIVNLSYSYGSNKVLNEISLSVYENDILFLIGNNGAGKTTLLKCMLNLLDIPRGNVYVNEKDVVDINIKNFSKMVSYVPQKIESANDFSVRDYLCMGRNPYIKMNNPTKEDYLIVDTYADKMEITDILDQSINNLSGGQKQWCSITRALIQETPIIIMDEPMASLDLRRQAELLILIKELQEKDNKTIMLTTHNPNHCLAIKSKVCLMENGIIIDSGDSKELLNSDNINRLYGNNITINNNVINFNIC